MRKKLCSGVGGVSVAYIHSVQLSLIDPFRSTKSKHVIAWTAKTKAASFIQKLDTGFGLLGMDIMRLWKSVCFESSPKKLHIRIRI